MIKFAAKETNIVREDQIIAYNASCGLALNAEIIIIRGQRNNSNLVFWTARHPGHFQQNFPLDIVMASLHYQNCLILKVTTKLLLSNCQIHTWYLSSASIAWVILHYVYKEGGGGACRYHAMWSEILNCYPNFSNFLAQVTWIKFASLNRLRINYFVNFYVHEFGGTVDVLFSQLCRMFHVMERTEHTQQKNYTFLRICFNRSFRVESN